MNYRTTIKVMLAISALFLVACGDDGDTATNGVGQQTEEAARDARDAAQDAWASVRTDAERLMDQIRTQDAPRLKEELLERCRDALERLRQAESERVGEVERLCDRIRDTDVSNTDAWADIRREIEQLDPTR